MRTISTFGIVALLACRDTGKPVIVNTKPTIDSISISPSENITTSTALLCVATASNNANDTLAISYQWTDADGNVLAQTAELVLSPDIVQPTSEITCTAAVTDGGNNVSDETSIIVVNTDPTISNVSISPQEIVVENLLECTYDAEDKDQEDLTVSYSWTQNGTEVGTDSSLQLDAETFADDDVIVCTVTVEDGYDGTASDSAEAVIGNTMPMIGSTTITPDPAYSYDTLTCTANDVTDLELDEVTISYEWSIDEEIQTETSNMLSGPFRVGALVACKTTPNDGKIDGETSQTHTAINNTAPVVDSVTITPAIVYADTLLTCEAAASDVDNEETTLSYEWTAQNGIVVGSDASVQLDPSIVSVLDVLTCTATITDPHGDTDSDTVSITVANSEPVVTTAAEITGDPTTTSTLFCSAVFDDVDDGTLPVSYTWTNQDGTQLGTADSYTILASETETGDVLTCTASGADAAGIAIESAASITVENTAPVIASVSLDNTSPTSQESITCTVDSASDIDEDTITYTYTWTVDGQVQAETTNVLAPPLLVGSLISCAVTPNDGKMDGDTETADATVQNTAPTVTSVSIDNGPFYTDDILTATVVLADDDGEQTLTANYEWHVIDSSAGNADLMLQSGASDALSGSQFFDKGDNVYVIVIPNDGVEDGASLTSVPVGISNSEPVGITASVTSSDMFYNDSTLTCAATASDIDPEDSALTYTYAWSTGDTGADLVLDGSMTPNSEVTCTATATDGSGAAISVDATGTLINRPPTVDSVSFDGSTYDTNDVITATAVLGDVDSAHVSSLTASFEWHILDASDFNTDKVVQSGSDNTLDGASHFDRDDEVYVIVTPNDGVENGSNLTSSSVTVLNSEPTDLTASVTSSDMFYNNSTLTCSASASDIDPEDAALTYDYNWSTGDTGADLVLTGSMMPGSDVTCTATATDGSGASISLDATETLVNRAPTIDSVTLPQDVTAETASVLCDATGSDLDGETPTLTYTWALRSEVTPESTNTLTETFVYNDVIQCVVVATDTAGDTALMSASTTVLNTAPIVDSVGFDGSMYYTNDIITATAVLSDVDSAQTSDLDASFEWHILDASDSNTDKVVQSGSDNTLDGVSHFDRDDEVYVIVTPNDGVEDGAPLTSTGITVLNTAPTAASISITPDPAIVEYDDLTCSVDVASTDADGDGIVYNYTWTDPNGDVQQTTTESSSISDVFFASGTSEGTWTCEVTSSDGTDDGSSDSTVATVENGCTSLEFDGSSDYIDLSSYPLLGDSFSHSVEVWFKPNVVDESVMIWAESWYFQLCDNSGKSYILEAEVELCDDIKVGEWNHLVASYDVTTGSKSIFLNEVRYSVSHDWGYITNNSANSAESMSFAMNHNQSNYYNGIIGDVRFWSKVFDLAAVKSSASIDPNTETDLLAYWNFSQSSTLLDLSGSGHNGTIYGATLTNTCPEEDLDGDGVAAWEDCDDGDSDVLVKTDYQESSTGDHFTICEGYTTWNTAESICNSLSQNLTSIENSTVNQWVSQVMTTHTPSTGVHSGWWIGLNDIQNSTNFVWTDGSPFSYTNWASGNPNHFADEDCGIMYTSNGGANSWHDATCTQLKSFICR